MKGRKDNLKNIVIASKAVVGMRPRPIRGMDKGLNIFKKSLSQNLQNKLKIALKENNMDYEVSIDQTYDSIEDIIKNNARLVLISPYIKENISL